MNYYERHIGDYAKDAGHLSMLEDGAYQRLLDRYYSTEIGIPADQAHRVARARTEEEKAAVDVVLDEFFSLVDGVWINHRAEEEIEKARGKIRAAQENGKRGGRPRNNPVGSETKTEEKPTGFQLGSENETQRKALQPPDTKHQISPEIEVVTPHSSGNAKEGAGAVSGTDAGSMSVELRKVGVVITPSNPELLSWLAQGATIPLVLDAVTEARVSKPEPEKIPAAYLTAIVRRMLAGPKPRASPAGKHNGFHTLDYSAGIDADGRF